MYMFYRLGVASSSETSEKIVILEKELAEKCSAMQQMDRQYRDKIEEFEAYVKQLQDGMGRYVCTLRMCTRHSSI